MAKFLNLLRLRSFANPGDAAAEISAINDTHPRLRIDAGGKLTWSSGTSSGDTTLYRDTADLLATDDVFKATGGLVTLTTNGAPTETLPDGAIAIDTTNGVFYFRTSSSWTQVTGGGGASIEIGDTPPLTPEEGDLWFESDTGSLFVYYDSTWVEMGGNSAGGATVLDGLTDVTISSPANGQVLKYNGTNWVNSTNTDGAWTTYTAWSIVQPGNVGTITYEYSKYTVINKTAIWNANVVFPSGTAGISGNLITISGLPIAAANAGSISGAWYYLESGVQHRTGTIHPATGSTTNFQLAFDGGGNFLGAAYALKANDRLRFTCTWEIA